MTGHEADRAEERARNSLVAALRARNELELDALIQAVQSDHPDVTAATVRAAILSLVNAGEAEVTSKGRIRELTSA